MSWKCHDTEVIILKTNPHLSRVMVGLDNCTNGTGDRDTSCKDPSGSAQNQAGSCRTHQLSAAALQDLDYSLQSHWSLQPPAEWWRGVCTTVQMYRAWSLAMPCCFPRGRNTGKVMQKDQLLLSIWPASVQTQPASSTGDCLVLPHTCRCLQQPLQGAWLSLGRLRVLGRDWHWQHCWRTAQGHHHGRGTWPLDNNRMI